MKDSIETTLRFRTWLQNKSSDYLMNTEDDKIIRTFVYVDNVIVSGFSLPTPKQYNKIFSLLKHEIPNELYTRINKCFAKYDKKLEQVHLK